MASLTKDPASGNYRVQFRLGGRNFHKSLKTASEKKATTMFAQLEETLHDLERGRLELPTDADVWEFLKSGGRREGRLQPPQTLTLQNLFDWYFSIQTPGGEGAEHPEHGTPPQAALLPHPGQERLAVHADGRRLAEVRQHPREGGRAGRTRQFRHD